MKATLVALQSTRNAGKAGNTSDVKDREVWVAQLRSSQTVNTQQRVRDSVDVSIFFLGGMPVERWRWLRLAISEC